MTVLRQQSQIPDASAEDLLETFSALTGQQAAPFPSIFIARRRVEMAMLAARDADAHTGVPKDTSGQVRTRKEIIKKAKDRGMPPPPPFDGDSE